MSTSEQIERERLAKMCEERADDDSEVADTLPVAELEVRGLMFRERAADWLKIASILRSQEGRRIEGWMFEGDDWFCDAKSPEKCQESLVFIPECEHQAATTVTGDQRATLILHEPTPEARE